MTGGSFLSEPRVLLLGVLGLELKKREENKGRRKHNTLLRKRNAPWAGSASSAGQLAMLRTALIKRK